MCRGTFFDATCRPSSYAKSQRGERYTRDRSFTPSGFRFANDASVLLTSVCRHQRDVRSLMVLIIALLASATVAAPQQIAPWEGMQRDVEAKLDQQLQRISNFETLDERFRATTRPSAPLTGRGVADRAATSSLALNEIPAPVSEFVKFYSGPGRNFYVNGIQRLRPYLPMIQEIFSREGVPVDLVWIGLVESAYNPAARSPRAAVGMWQLIPETASRYGLAVGTGIDERTDPVKSTLAAARFLRHLYEVFGDWNLVLAAYNSGEQRVVQSMARGATTDFWELARRQLLPRETQDYVPAVLAAKIVGESWPETDDIRSVTSSNTVKKVE